MQTTSLHTPVNSLTGRNDHAGIRLHFSCDALDAPSQIPAGGISLQLQVTSTIHQFCVTSKRGG
jgi:hypothetical protein